MLHDHLQDIEAAIEGSLEKDPLAFLEHFRRWR